MTFMLTVSNDQGQQQGQYESTATTYRIYRTHFPVFACLPPCPPGVLIAPPILSMSHGERALREPLRRARSAGEWLRDPGAEALAGIRVFQRVRTSRVGG